MTCRRWRRHKARTLGQPVERKIFPDGKDSKGRAYADFRWSRFRDFEARELYDLVAEHVFPFLRTLGGDGSTYAHHMKDARFTIPTPALLVKVVDLIAALPMEGRDTKGDLYEYMLSKIATAGQNGQFRTPRHIIQLMVELTQPTPNDWVCDPACGTAGFPGRSRRVAPRVTIPTSSTTASSVSTSTRACSTASISIPPCCALAA